MASSGAAQIERAGVQRLDPFWIQPSSVQAPSNLAVLNPNQPLPECAAFLKFYKFPVILADLDSPDIPVTHEGHSLRQSQLSHFFGGIE